MNLSGLLVQILNGFSDASSLFLVAAGLSLIFGVTHIVNFAHGSFYMIGAYLAYTVIDRTGNPIWFWPSLVIAAVAVGALGALTESTLLRRIYRAPDLLQLLATFAIMMIIKDAALWLWGPMELLGPRAPGLGGSVEVLGRKFPTYDLFLIALGPTILGVLWLLIARTRWGRLVRAATQDREMVSALGINQAWLFTAVFALGAMMAGLGGALQLPKESANLEMDLHAIGSAFVVVVVGGMGSISGAYVAALLIAQIKALCVWLGVVHLFGIDVSFSKLTLVVEFVVMAAVLVVRPWGLFGQPQGQRRVAATSVELPLRRASRNMLIGAAALLGLLALMPTLTAASPYVTVLLIDVLIASLFAASLHFIMGPGGLHSFGHAAYFGLGAYGAALLIRRLGVPMEIALFAAPLVAAFGALLFGWFCVRLSGVYLAMLTMAFGQIAWASVYQWDSFAGGSNGLTGVWPSAWAADKRAYYYLTLALTAAALVMLYRVVFSPFGFTLRAARDSVLRAEAIGIDVKRVQWVAFVCAGLVAGLAGALFAFSKGSISPESLHVSKSIDGLVMVLLGGVQTLVGPIVGAATFTWLQDTIGRNADYWRAVLGAVILMLILVFPRGIAGSFADLLARRRGSP
ncbi:MAG: ABC transporter permease [Rubrivivax sp.]|nr:ABC transporter permease [Rubrivivax sp.]